MGSSRKHKEKEKERSQKDKEYRKRQRSRSRSRSRDRHRHHKKHKRSRREEHLEPKSEFISSDESDGDCQIVPTTQERSPNADADDLKVQSSGGEISMSIEETNRLRAKLGLKSLSVDSAKPTHKGESSEKGGEHDEEKDSENWWKKENDFVHAPPVNIGHTTRTEKLREKFKDRRERNEMMVRLIRVNKGLGDSDSDGGDSAASWVKQSRKTQKQKELASKRAKMLEELDEEFGVGDLVQEELKNDRQSHYTSRHLSGLTVEHDFDSFVEGKATILTLKDQDVLSESTDTLVNVNMIDVEKGKKNVENKNTKPGYDAYEEDKLDEYGVAVKRNMLSKYDEEIGGQKSKLFVLRGDKDTSKEDMMTDEEYRKKQLEMIKNKLKKKTLAENLETPALQLAREYYTSEEMQSKFKKTKKKVKKVREKKKILTADELEKMGRGDTEACNLSVLKRESDDMDLDLDDIDIKPDISSIRIDFEDDQADLQRAIQKTMKMKQKEATRVNRAEEIAERIKSIKEEEPDDDNNAALPITLNSTAEFCRTLGEIPTYGRPRANRGDNDEDDKMVRKIAFQGTDVENPSDEEAAEGAWNSVVSEKKTSVAVDDAPILEEEPDVSRGIAGALKFSMNKGYLEKETKKSVSMTTMKHLQAKNYSIEDKNYEDDKHSRRERYSGPSMEFKEKSNYKPDVKIDYIGDDGKELNEKEAFRHLSHKFHGKGSSKNKIDKRINKSKQEALMRQMSATDTPLGTVTLLQQRQKETNSPYVVLSAKALQGGSIAKQK